MAPKRRAEVLSKVAKGRKAVMFRRYSAIGHEFSVNEPAMYTSIK